MCPTQKEMFTEFIFCTALLIKGTTQLHSFGQCGCTIRLCTDGRWCLIYPQVLTVFRLLSDRRKHLCQFHLPSLCSFFHVCVCVSLRQPQRTMAFAGMLNEEDIKAAVQACQGESDMQRTLTRRETHTIYKLSNHKHKNTSFAVSKLPVHPLTYYTVRDTVTPLPQGKAVWCVARSGDTEPAGNLAAKWLGGSSH